MQIANPVLNALKEREFTDLVEENLAKHGYAFIGVNNASDDPEKPTPAYVYTVGLHQINVPDLFISGNLPQETAMRLVNFVIEFWERQGKIKLGRINNFLLSADKRTKYAIGLKEVVVDEAIKTHMEELEKRFPDAPGRRVVQILWPDLKGYLPINDNYSADATDVQHLLPWVE